jgi:hypothetical protein
MAPVPAIGVVAIAIAIAVAIAVVVAIGVVVRPHRMASFLWALLPGCEQYA